MKFMKYAKMSLNTMKYIKMSLIENEIYMTNQGVATSSAVYIIYSI